jgi:hypothetical protein
MTALGFDQVRENPGAVEVSTSFLGVRRVIGGWLACLIPIQPTMGSHALHYGVDLAHPMLPDK